MRVSAKDDELLIKVISYFWRLFLIWSGNAITLYCRTEMTALRLCFYAAFKQAVNKCGLHSHGVASLKNLYLTSSEVTLMNICWNAWYNMLVLSIFSSLVPNLWHKYCIYIYILMYQNTLWNLSAAHCCSYMLCFPNTYSPRNIGTMVKTLMTHLDIEKGQVLQNKWMGKLGSTCIERSTF